MIQHELLWATGNKAAAVLLTPLAVIFVAGCGRSTTTGSPVPMSSPAPAAHTTPVVTPPAVAVSVLRPIGRDGRVSTGVRFSDSSRMTEIDCRSPVSADSAALGPDIYACYPLAAGAQHCFVPPNDVTALCFQPISNTVVKYRIPQSLPAVSPSVQPVPVKIGLADGHACIEATEAVPRDSGQLVSYFACQTAGAATYLWAKPDSPSITTASNHWTVEVGKTTGPLMTIAVKNVTYLDWA